MHIGVAVQNFHRGRAAVNRGRQFSKIFLWRFCSYSLFVLSLFCIAQHLVSIKGSVVNTVVFNNANNNLINNFCKKKEVQEVITFHRKKKMKYLREVQEVNFSSRFRGSAGPRWKICCGTAIAVVIEFFDRADVYDNSINACGVEQSIDPFGFCAKNCFFKFRNVPDVRIIT